MPAVGDVRQPERESEKINFHRYFCQRSLLRGSSLLHCSPVHFNLKSTATVCFNASAGPPKMFNLPVFAYLDPGAGSLLLQALVGGFAGLLVVGRHLFRMVRMVRPSQPQVEGSQVAAENA